MGFYQFFFSKTIGRKTCYFLFCHTAERQDGFGFTPEASFR